ncbi:MAG: zf-HC2 domain-containing protein [Planctomycetes bacterium]|nr:zf-HC2 domain-containing protein [Planctomycetota bacterium]
MNCGRVLRSLPLYVSGDLSARRAGSVRAHLGGCAACADRASRYARDRSLLAALRPAAGPAMPEDLARGFWQAVHRETFGTVPRSARDIAAAATAGPARLHGSAAALRRWAVSGTCAVLVGLAAYQLSRGPQTSMPVPPVTPVARSVAPAREAAFMLVHEEDPQTHPDRGGALLEAMDETQGGRRFLYQLDEATPVMVASAEGMDF